MAEALNLQINIGGKEQIVSTFGELKKAIKDAEFEALKLSQQFGEADPRVQQLRKQIGQLKDSIQDSAEATQNFAKGAGVFPAISKTIQGVAGGFAAVQGAIGLLGVESKEVEKQLLKVQSALALSQGIEQVLQSVDAFNNLGAIIKNNVVKAFTGLKAAIGATGIGALAIALTLVIGYFDDIKRVVLNLFPGLEKLGKFVGNLVQNFTDFVGITSQAERNLEALEKQTKRGNEEIENRIKILTAQGGKEDEIYKLSKKRSEDELNFLREKLKTKGKLTEEELKQFRDLKVQKEVLDINEQNRLNKLAEENAKKAEEARKKEQARIAVLDEKAQAARTRLINDQIEGRGLAIKKEDELKEKRKQADQDEQKNIQSIVERAKATAASVQNEANYLDWLADKKKKDAEADKAIKKAKFDSEVALAQQTLSIIGGLVDQNSVAGKAIAITQAIINTYQGASKAIAQGGIFGPVAAAATIAAGFIQVKKIASTKVPSAKGNGSVGSSGMPSMSNGASPITPTTEVMPRTSLNQETINAIGNQAVRAYVVETDISSSQKRIEAIKQKAKFG